MYDNAGKLDRNLVKGNEAVVRKLHAKYTHALDALEPEEGILDGVERGAELRGLLTQIRGNLSALGEELDSGRWD